MERASRRIALDLRTDPHPGGRLSRWLVVVLVVLLSLVGQNMLIETHLHLGRASNSAASGDASARWSGRAGSHSHTGDCTICREAAAAGHFLPAVAPAVHIAPRAPIWSAPLLDAGGCASPIAFERCRGPPSPLDDR